MCKYNVILLILLYVYIMSPRVNTGGHIVFASVSSASSCSSCSSCSSSSTHCCGRDNSRKIWLGWLKFFVNMFLYKTLLGIGDGWPWPIFQGHMGISSKIDADMITQQGFDLGGWNLAWLCTIIRTRLGLQMGDLDLFFKVTWAFHQKSTRTR